MNNYDQTFAQLQQLGLIAPNPIVDSRNPRDSDAAALADNLANPADDNDSTPWFIHLFFGFSGVLSSIFLVGFLSLILYQAEVFDSSLLQLLVGIILSAIAFTLFKNKKSADNTFWNSLAFALSGAGQLYLMFALFGSEITQPLSLWLFLLIQVTMTLVMPNFIYRLLSSAAVLGVIVYLLSFYQLPELSLALLALVTIMANLQRYWLISYLPIRWRAGAFDISKALSYASAFVLLIFSIYIFAGDYNVQFISNKFSYNYYMAQGLLVMVSLYGAHLILQRYQMKLLSFKSPSQPDIIIVCVIIIIGIISVYVSGLLSASIVIIIGIANSQRLLLGVGLLALVSYIFWYYYQLDSSLLIKSGSMLLIAISILLIRWLLVSRYIASDLPLTVLRTTTANLPPKTSVGTMANQDSGSDDQELPS